MKDRLLAKIKIDDHSGCWNWTASRSNGRYGKLEIKGKTLSAHRASYETFLGAIPEGMFVLHRCDNMGCVNPNHLFLGTQADNVADKMKKGRHRVVRGVELPQSKLTDADVIAIKTQKDVSNADFARRLNVDPSVISDVRRRKKWAHILP